MWGGGRRRTATHSFSPLLPTTTTTYGHVKGVGALFGFSEMESGALIALRKEKEIQNY
jgi:hypothetical protein